MNLVGGWYILYRNMYSRTKLEQVSGSTHGLVVSKQVTGIQNLFFDLVCISTHHNMQYNQQRIN